MEVVLLGKFPSSFEESGLLILIRSTYLSALFRLLPLPSSSNHQSES